MMKNCKRTISFLLCMAMLLGNFPVVSFAAETDGLCEHHTEHLECGYVEGESACGYVCEICAQPTEETNEPPVTEEPTEPEVTEEPTESETTEETAGQENMTELDIVVTGSAVQSAPDVGLPENEELFAYFAERELYGYDMATYGTAARENLNTAEQAIYDALKTKIEAVAVNGGSTVFAVSGISDVKIFWTNTQLGVSSIDDPTIVETAFVSQFSLDSIVAALLSDCPFDLYWYDKTVGVSIGYEVNVYGYNNGTQDIWDQAYVSGLTFTFAVATDYASDSNTVTADVARITAARDNAAQVVANNASKSDYEKLVAYKDYICGAVSYNQSAAENSNAPYGAPWQLIYVFDGDTSTNVVCEGYSKAFQYLCDLTTFTDSTSCYSVSGQMDGGDHMWNIVTLDGSNYLIDVTNSDSGAVGQDGSLFLAGGSGSAATGYSVDGNSYVYDSATLSQWGTGAGSILNLAAESYKSDEGGANIVASGTCGSNATWTLDDNGTLTISGTGETEEYGYIGELYGAPFGHDHLSTPWTESSVTSFVVEEGITRILGLLCWGAYNLTNVSLPDSLKTIGHCSFEECYSLTSITIPKNVASIWSGAFWSCENLTSITFTGDAPSINDYAFDSAVTATCYYPSNNATWTEEMRQNYGGTLTWIAYCTEQSHEWQDATCSAPKTCSGCGETEGEPDPAKHYFVDGDCAYCGIQGGSCGTNAFWTLDAAGAMIIYGSGKMTDYSAYNVPWYSSRSQIKALTVKEGITHLGNYAFRSCTALETVDLPATLETVGNDAFVFCSALSEIKLPQNLVTLGSNAFYGCSALTEITIPAGVVSIGNWAFSGAAIKTVRFEGTAPEIAAAAFNGVTATVYYPAEDTGWKGVAGRDFGGTLTWVPPVEGALIEGVCGDDLTWRYNALEKTLIILGTGAMYDYTQDSVPWAAYRDQITSVSLPTELTRIGDFAFFGFEKLTALIIPDKMTSLGQRAFEGCCNIAFTVSSQNRSFMENNGALYDYYGRTLYSAPSVSGKYVPNYQTQYIRAYAFAGNKTITEFETLGRIYSVGEYAFDGCSNLKTLFFRGNAPAFGENAFRGVTATAQYLSNDSSWTASVKQNYGGKITWKSCNIIASYQGSSGYGWELTTDGVLTFHSQYRYDIPSGSNSNSAGSWYNYRDQIKHVVIPAPFDAISAKAFEYCTKLETVTMEKVDDVGANAFYGCTGLKSIYICSGGAYQVTIGDYAFYGCTSLEEASLNIRSNIGSYAFGGCSGLKSIYLNSAQAFMDGNFSAQSTSFSGVTADVLCPYGVRTDTKQYGGKLTYKNVSYGTCGPDVEWSVNESTGTLSLYGTGSVSTYYSGSYTPWTYYSREKIKHIVLGAGITVLPEYTFEYCIVLEDVELSNTLTTISPRAFNDCYVLNNLLIPRSVTTFVSGSHFTRCPQLTDIYYLGTEEEWSRISNADSFKVYSSGYNEVDYTLHFLQWNQSTATCTQAGQQGHYGFADSSVYDYKYDENWNQLSKLQAVPALGHQWSEWTTVDATCTEDGSKTRSCQRDGCDETETDVIEATGHDHKAVVTAPTCTEAGYTTHTCSCGDSYTDSEKAALGHSFTEYASNNDATCTVDGTKTAVCDRNCGEKDTVTDTDSAKGHTFDQQNTADTYKASDATCTDAAKYYYSCTCGETGTETFEYGNLNSQNHALEDDVCSECGAVKISETTFPDTNFRAYITSLSSGTDGWLTAEELSKVTAVDVDDMSIASLKGIEYFTALTFLDCSDNQLTSLDVTNCTALTTFYCVSNQLASLDVSKCTVLEFLACDDNQLTSLDVSKCTALRSLFCYSNQLTSLDVTNCTALTTLYCSSNQLTSLDVTNCTALTTLYCSSNQLTSLDVTNRTELTKLDCDSNQLTSLDVSKCTVLEFLACGDNQLTSLDVDRNTALSHLWCNGNQLTSLDVSNCTALTSLDFGSNQLTSLDVSKCTALTSLYCYSNQLTSLDVSNCTALTTLYCHNNRLTNLDVSKCAALTSLHCYSNQLTSLDISGCAKLDYLYCYGNKRTVSATQNRFDLGVLTADGFDIGKTSNWQGGTVSGNILTATDETVTYTYDLGNNKTETFTLTIEGFCKHSWVDATCTAPKICSECMATEGNALGHDMEEEWTITKDATCTEDGSKRKDCSRCDHFETEVIKAAGHDHKAVVTAPTCTEKGYTTHTCYCGNSYVDNYVDALGHDMGEWTVTEDATCTEDGSKRSDCSRCDHFETEVIEATGHDHKAVVTAPTCTEAGYTTHTCSCGDSYTDSEKAALGHDMGEWKITEEATCTEEGSKRSDCSRCDHFETDVIEATGHDHKAVVTAPTCTEAGYTTHTCHCGDTYTGDEEPALGHDMGEWKTTKEPEIGVEGEKERSCKREGCSHKETEKLPMLEEPKWNVAFANMSLSNSLAMNFAFARGNETDWTGCYAKITKTYADGRPDAVVTLPAAQWGSANIGGVPHYTISFQGIAAKEMGDEIHVCIYNADGEAVSNVWTDSALKYALRAYGAANATEKEKRMLIDMLNYGAAAQQLFGYDAEHLVTAGLSDEQKAMATKTVEAKSSIEKGANYLGTNLSLESEIRINMAFKDVSEGMYAKVSFTNHAGRKIEEVAQMDIEGSTGIVRVNQIAVADGRTIVTVTVHKTDGSVHGSVVDSLEGYISRVIDKEQDRAELYRKILMFADSTYNFKH